MSDSKQPAALPAPLALTLDEARTVAGGLSVSQVALLTNFKPWYWFGQPANPYVSQVNVGAAKFGG